MAKSPGRPRGAKSPVFNHPDKHYSAPRVEEREPAPNFDLLSDERKAKLTEDAKSKVEARERVRAEDAFLAAEIERIERELIPDAHEEMKEIVIDLALGNDQIVLDGKWYMYGRTYTVKKSIYDSLREIIQRTHWHYAQTHTDPTEAAQRASQAIAKGGSSFATINASSGQVARF